MDRKTWKAHERQVAAIVGGERKPITGRRGPDVISPVLELEVKARASLPAVLQLGLDQAAKWPASGKLKGVVLCSVGRGRKGEKVICFRLAEWAEWYGKRGKL